MDRRTFLKGAAAFALSGLAAPLAACDPLGTARAPAATPRPTRSPTFTTPIRHVLVDLQENRSFDHYYGYADFAGPHGVPADYTQPDGSGGTVAPHHLSSTSTSDVPHYWSDIHHEFNGGKMDGFFVADGANALGYYTAADLPYYYSLFAASTLCVNYFCSVLGPTYPNRLYAVAGTSGGITTNGVFGYGVIDFPCILDLLDEAGVSWKAYNIGLDPVDNADTNNVFFFFKRWAHDPRIAGSKNDYMADLERGTLPNVSFLVPGFLDQVDEHPPANIQQGMNLQRELITALQRSSAWSSSAYILSYDEAGGFFDHVPPPQIDAFGLGIRVPTWVISPFAKRGHLEATLYDHSSILKFVEAVFGLPALASVNHRFDSATTTGPDYQAGGANSGPPAPPRDGRHELGDLTECFSFS